MNSKDFSYKKKKLHGYPLPMSDSPTGSKTIVMLLSDYNRSIFWALIYFFCGHVTKGLETKDGLNRFSSRPTNTLFEKNTVCGL